MGTVFSLVAAIAAVALVLVPAGTVEMFVAFGVILVGLLLAAWLRPRPGFMAVAVMLGSFGILVSQPFSLTRQQLGALKRAERDGDEAAKAMIDLYAGMEPYATWVMLLTALVVVCIFVFAAWRAHVGAHRFILAESEALAALTQRIGMAAAFLYVPMIIIIVYDVLQRKYLDINSEFTNTTWYQVFTSTRLQEMEWHLHAVLFLMCLGFAYVKDAHVRIELVRERLGPRTRVWMELIGCALFMVPYCYVIIRYGTEFSLRSFEMLERSSAQTGLEYRFIIKAFLPIGFMVLAMAGISVALKCIVYLFGPPSLRQVSGYYAGVHHADIPDRSDEPAAAEHH